MLLASLVCLGPYAQGADFTQSLSKEGIRFDVFATNEGSINQLTIKPSGLTVDNAVIKREIDGSVVSAQVADLNSDHSPEIFVFVSSAGSGAYGSLVAYASNHKKSLTDIYLPDIMDDKAASQGYMGHDKFSIKSPWLVRKFPIYQDGDTNNQPTGGERSVFYRLKAGEAGWILALEKVHNTKGR